MRVRVPRDSRAAKTPGLFVDVFSRPCQPINRNIVRMVYKKFVSVGGVVEHRSLSHARLQNTSCMRERRWSGRNEDYGHLEQKFD